jgi:diphosphoinositol-polyphosphate diphosphatase
MRAVPHALKQQSSSTSSCDTELSSPAIDTDPPRVSQETKDLQAMCFPESFSLISEYRHEKDLSEVAIVSEYDFTDDDNNASAGSSTSSILLQLQQKSVDANAKVSKEVASRQGRSLQRWAIDPKSGRSVRLVAGCVPILKDGRVLLISSSKKVEWLVPKGGWELDECLEEGAIRECFEESGVLGTLGPKFDDFIQETRKARKRRLELEEKMRNKPETANFCSGWSVLSQLSEDDHLLSEDMSDVSEKASHNAPLVMTPHSDSCPAPGTPKTGVRVTFQLADSATTEAVNYSISDLVPMAEPIKSIATEDTGSISSLTHTHVVMTLFPLYVQQVHDYWPEMTRIRRAFSIDGAYQQISNHFFFGVELIPHRFPCIFLPTQRLLIWFVRSFDPSCWNSKRRDCTL